jgi:hypothetical protein
LPALVRFSEFGSVTSRIPKSSCPSFSQSNNCQLHFCSAVSLFFPGKTCAFFVSVTDRNWDFQRTRRSDWRRTASLPESWNEVPRKVRWFE